MLIQLLFAISAGIASAQDTTTVEIANGVHMPRLNLGTCCGSKPEIGIPAWFAAGGVGIDTAWDYQDQPTIGKMLKQSGKKRGDYFITTKVPAGVGVNEGNTSDCSADPQIALNYVKDDLKQLGLEYVDLVLLHGPCRFGAPEHVPDPTASDNALWKGLQAALTQGLTRAIGVSNYNSSELAALEGPAPAVNQCQMSVGPASTTLPMPHIAHDDATIQYCKAHGITYESWRAVGGCPMSDTKVSAIAKAHGKTAAQICLRWVLQQGAIIASGTGSKKVEAYTKQDFEIFNFTLTDSEMSVLSTISPSSANPSIVI